MNVASSRAFGTHHSLDPKPMADRVHELPNDQLRAKLAGGELSDKKLLPRAVIRRRRRERIQAWLQRHAWVGAIRLFTRPHRTIASRTKPTLCSSGQLTRSSINGHYLSARPDRSRVSPVWSWTSDIRALPQLVPPLSASRSNAPPS
jgi:hypothetical protein